jgi:hypothetical protein
MINYTPVRSIVDEHNTAELEYKRLLALHTTDSEQDDLTTVIWLQNLAQALEGQNKYDEGLETRLRARDVLITLMVAS